MSGEELLQQPAGRRSEGRWRPVDEEQDESGRMTVGHGR